MDLDQRLRQFDELYDWQGLLESLEAELGEATEPAERAALHLQLGVSLTERCLRSPEALGHFRSAFKLNSELTRALSQARELYWELGNLPMAKRLLEAELQATGSRPESSPLWLQLGDLLANEGREELAGKAYQRALNVCSADSGEATGRLLDLAIDSDGWGDYLTDLQRAADAAPDAAERADALLRVARVARRLDVQEAASLLKRAYEADPLCEQLVGLYEAPQVESEGEAFVAELQRQVLSLESDVGRKAQLALKFGARWVSCYHKPELALEFLEFTLRCQPDNERAFAIYRHLCGAEMGDWEAVANLAEELASRVGEESSSYLWAAAASVAMNQLGDPERARRYYDCAATVAPGLEVRESVEDFAGNHPTLENGAPMTAERPEVSESEAQEEGAMASDDPGAEQGREVEHGVALADDEEGGATLPPDALSSLPPGPISSLPADVLSSLPPGPSSSLPADAFSSLPPGPNSLPADALSSLPPSANSLPAEALSSLPPGPTSSLPADALSSLPPGRSSSLPAGGLSSVPPNSPSSRANEGSGAPLSAAPSVTPASVAARASSCAPSDTGRNSTGAPPSSQLGLHVAASDEEIAALKERLAGQERQNRAHEVVKSLVALGDAVASRDERVEFYVRAADLYSNKFMNQAEAVKTHEKILAIRPGEESSLQFLLQMYEKRRDWEKLIRLRRAQAQQVDDEFERAAALKELAELATSRVKKPAICIELWQAVLDVDPNDAAALASLAKLYERSRDFEKLAFVLERLVVDADGAERSQLLTKLGQIVGDRLKDDERAIVVYRQLVELEPDNRRAQEQLKKRYVTLGRWDDLDDFYAASGRWDEFIRVLESNEARADTVEQRIRMLMKIADLWQTQRQRPERASRAYEKIMSLDSTNLEAATCLIPIYTKTNNAKGLAGVLEVKLGDTPDVDEKLGLLRQLTELYEGRLKNPESAYERSRMAFELSPLDPEVQAVAERLAGALSEWQPLVNSYQIALQQCEEEGQHEEQASLRLQLGQIYVDKVGELEEGLLQFRAVSDAQPENVEALRALEGLYLSTERFSELLEVYSRLAALADSPSESCEIAREIARVYEEKLGDQQSAVESYQVVLVQEPFDAGALLALDRLLPAIGDWEQHAEVLERRLELDVSEQEVADIKFRLGQDHHLHLDNVDQAMLTYREVLSLVPGHEGARLALEGFLADESLQGAAAQILAGIYEILSDWENLINVLGVLAVSAEDATQQAEVLGKVAEVAETHLEDAARAFDAQTKALVLTPDNEFIVAELERLAALADAWTRLGELFHEVADQLGQSAESRAFRLRAARNEERLGNIANAARNYERLLEMDPSDSDALLAIDSLYRNSESWQELLGVFERRIELSESDEDTMTLYGQMAMVQADKLRRMEDAIVSHRAILGIDPTREEALLALDELLSTTEQWVELSENLETRLKLAVSEEKQRELMLRLAALCESQLEDVERAIDTYRDVLERDPYDSGALSALERLGQGTHELVVAEILEPLYQQLGEYDKLVAVYEVQARRAEDPSRQVELFHRIASLHEDVAGNVSSAFQTYARALEIDPLDETTSEGLERIARAGGKFNELAEVYESLAERQEEEPGLSAQLFSAAARIVEVDIDDSERAIALYRKVQQASPEDLPSLEALQRLFQIAENHGELSQVLQRKCDIVTDVTERKAALFEAATLEEDVLGRPDEAIVVYQKLLDIDPDDVRSLDSLASLYLDLSRWELLLEVQLRKVDLAENADDKKAIYYQMGAVYERELEDVKRATDTYQHVLELDPDDIMALGRLDVLYQAAENWGELLTVLGHEAELTSDPAEAVSYQYRIAELYERRLEDVERATELYRDVLNIQPEHAPTLKALEGLKSGDTEFALLAASVLEPVYDAMAEWASLVSVLSVQAKFADDSFSKIEILHRIALLHEERMGDHGGAFDWYARAVREDSSNEDSLGALERLAAATERWPSVAELYEGELAGLSDDPMRRVELGLRVAQVHEVQLSHVDAAVSQYRGVLEIETENPVAIRALSRLFQQVERWGDLAKILQQEALIAATPDEILDCKYRLGRVYQEHLQDYESAVAAYDDVLGSAPEHESSRSALEELFAEGHCRGQVASILEPLYEAGAQWDRLVQVHEAQLVELTDAEERLDLYHRICEDYEERLVDSYRAFGVLARALLEQPLSERLHLEMERLATAFDGGWEELANTYADVMSVEGTAPEVQAQMGRQLARVFEDELADVDKAEEAYRYVLTVLPGEPQALTQLDRIYVAMEQWAELAGVLEQRAGAAEEPYQKVELYSRLGRVYEEQLEQLDSALNAYRLIFDDLAPSDADATAALVRIYEAKQQWERLQEVFLRQLESALGDVEQAEIRARLARLASDHLGRSDEAIDGWKRVLDLRGEDTEALDALGTLYERGEHWAELGDVLERLYDVALEDDERVHALTRRAVLFTDALKRHDEAIEAWNRVLDIDFSNLQSLKAIASLRRGKDEHVELADALHQIVDRASDGIEPDELREVHRELANLYEGVLEQPEESAEAWRHLLGVDSSDLEAMERLEKIYRSAEAWADVVGIQLQRSTVLEQPEEKVAQLLAAALIWKDEVREYDRAVEVFDRVLEVDPTHLFAFDELEKLHSLAERWEPLVEVYLARLDATEEAEGRGDLLRRIARSFEKHLDDPGQAFDALVSAFAEDFGDDETVSYLERMAQTTQRWGELISTTNEWLQEQTEDKEKIQLCLRLGKWYGENLGRPEYAQPYYAQITKLDPNNAQVLRQMAHIYRQSAQWKKMGDSLYKALEVAVANDDRKTILVDLGELLDKHMNKRDEGVTYFRRALDVDPYHLPALDALERIYAEAENFIELAEVLERKTKGLREREEIAEVQTSLAELYEQKLGAWDKAGAVYRAVVEYDSGNVNALLGLQRVYEQTQNWSDLASILERQLDVVDTERARLDALLKLAEVQEEQFLKSDLAAERLEQALEIDPSEVQAYSALERCYRRLKQWAQLVTACERHISEVTETPIKVELFEQIAQVYADELGEPDLAIDAYENIVALQPNHLPSLTALARLHDKQGDAMRSIEVMVQVADLTTDGRQRVEMYYRIGRALEDKVMDRGQAKERFELALDIDPTHLQTISALREIAKDEADWDSVAQYLDQERQHTESNRAKARLLVELGQVRSEMLGEREQGVAAFEQAIEVDTECEEAAMPLVQEYVSSENWEKAVPLAEMLVRRGKGREPAELQELQRLLGTIHQQLGNYQPALAAFQAAHQLDVTDTIAIEGLAAVSFDLKDWPSALTNYQKVLSSTGDDDPDRLTEVYYRLGHIKKAQGQSKQAINNFEKALAVLPDHRMTLEALSEVHAAEGQWSLVAEFKRRTLELLLEDDERVAMLVEISKVWGEKEKEPARAIEALEEAREIKPQDHVLLHGLLQHYQAVGDWSMMVETLASISEMEKEGSRKARYSYTMAQLYRDKIQDLDRAVELFNEALDYDAGLLEAFERINKILTQEKNWKQLERQYRKMLHRVAGKGNSDLEFTLWHQLGLVYRDRLSSVQPALEAFKMASSLRPDESQERVILSELHEVAGQFDEAIVEQRILLEKQPLSVSPYRALYRLYSAKGAVDPAWCTAGALVFMQQATAEERAFYEKRKTVGMPQMTGRVNSDAWARHIIHRDQNVYISKLFEMLTPAALQAKIAMLKAKRQLPELDKRLLQDPKNSTVTFAKTFFWASNILSVHAPELYVRSDIPGSVVAVPMLPPASLAGQTVLTGFTPQELTFICGKHLSSYRGEHYIRTLFPTQAELTILLFAGILLASPNTPMPPDMAQQIRMTAQELARYIQPVQHEGLRAVVKHFIQEGAKANMKLWNQAVEMTAARVGLILCGDLEICKKVLSSEQPRPGEPTAAEKMKSLLAYSVSEDYLKVRRVLGVAL